MNRQSDEILQPFYKAQRSYFEHIYIPRSRHLVSCSIR